MPKHYVNFYLSIVDMHAITHETWAFYCLIVFNKHSLPLYKASNMPMGMHVVRKLLSI